MASKSSFFSKTGFDPVLQSSFQDDVAEAAASATAAAVSATASASSQSAASLSAIGAAASATSAASSATGAASSATAAAGSATAASTSAAAAATSATVAASSATGAAASATTATTQASNASTSATNAASSATAAVASATAASGSATAAAASATAAAASATTAAGLVGGSLNGTSSAKTALYTVVNGDKRETFSLGGASEYTVTLGAPSGYDTDFQVRFYNADALRGKLLAISGYTTFRLWPLQAVTLQRIGSAWVIFGKDIRWKSTSAVAIYVDPSGNDVNDGLTVASAKFTIQAAWDTILAETDGPFYIQLTPGATYSGTANGNVSELDGDRTASYGRLIQITGDPTLVNPAIIAANANGPAITLRDGAWSIISGIDFHTGVNSSTAVSIQQTSLGDIQNCRFGNCPLGNQIDVYDRSHCNLGGTIALSQNGSAASFLRVHGGAKAIVGCAFDAASKTFVYDNFVVQDLMSSVEVQSPFSTANTGSLTAKKYVLTNGCFLSKGGFTFPGGTAGTADATSLAY